MDKNTNLYTVIIEGNYEPENIYISKKIFRILMTVIFPPLGVFYTQFLTGFPEPSKILVTLILTLMLYVPGLIYGLRNLDVDDPTLSIGYEVISTSNYQEDMNRIN
jgi:uncharacterized membrane protein YqaE (UPF0057 family)